MQMSVQEMFNGPGFNPEWLLMKAEYEFKTTMSAGTRFMENATNLSVTLAHMADWVFAFKPVAFKNFNYLGDVINHVKAACPKAALFFDISNEYKHADRKHPSQLTAKVLLYADRYESTIDISALNDGSRIFVRANDGKQIYVLTPKIKDCSGIEYLFSDCVAEAISWWRSSIQP